MEGLLIRQMDSEDIATAMSLKNAESWNQTENDWRFFLEHDPELCLVASLKNEVIGTVTAINYQNRIAWIGMMLVSSDHRRKGVGHKLLCSIIDRLADCNSIGLDATPAGALVYQRLGFEEVLGLIRMSTQAIRVSKLESYVGSVEPIKGSDISEVCLMDAKAFGAYRSDLIQNLVKNSPGHCLRAKREGKVVGFILGRKGTRYTHLGPVVADSLEDAKALVSQVSKKIEGSPTVVDVPADWSEWQSWLPKLGFSQQRTLSRMYLRPNRTGGKSNLQYGICGPEFG